MKPRASTECIRPRFDRPCGPVLTAALILLLGSACGPSAGNGRDGSVGGDGGDATDLDAGQPCTDHSQCPDGLCLSGMCCANDSVCGLNCCGGDEVCFANACVVPGDPCYSAADCGPNQYCELALGDGETGPHNEFAVCIYPQPENGRCLDLPPNCDDPNYDPQSGIECIPTCEYHPDPNGPLNAAPKWSWGPVADEFANKTDVWSTPAVGRLHDTNCDGVVNHLDPPDIVFVSGNARQTCCSCGGYTPSTCLTGVLRVLDGKSGQEIFSLDKATSGSIGFAGISVAIGDLDRNGWMDIAAVTGEGNIAVIDATGNVTAISDEPVGSTAGSFGWGGGLAIADMDGDGNPEIAYGAAVFTTAGGGVTHLFTGAHGTGGSGWNAALSVFADLDGAPANDTELLVGNAVYKYDGSELWYRSDLPTGFSAVGNFDGTGGPEVVLVSGGQVWILDGATGLTRLGPKTLGGTGNGGPPTVADFDGDGSPEIGVAMQNVYSMLKPDFNAGTLNIVWEAPNHDLSSSVTGSTVFDFEGDGKAEVIYMDECFLWVYDGTTGNIRFATPTTTFTATEAALVADVDGDGHAEMIMTSNGADPSASGWKCDISPWNEPDPATGRPAWVAPSYGPAYRGMTLFGDSASSWVGTRTLWNQHTYHVTNICDPRDSACEPGSTYGMIPNAEKKNWEVSWLNNFRQNVQDSNLFNAPDATVTLNVDCTTPPILHAWVRNLGSAILPSGVEVGLYVREGSEDRLLYTDNTTTALFPGQMAEVVFTTDAADGFTAYTDFVAKIHTDPDNPLFHECRDDNNESEVTKATCVN